MYTGFYIGVANIFGITGYTNLQQLSLLWVTVMS